MISFRIVFERILVVNNIRTHARLVVKLIKIKYKYERGRKMCANCESTPTLYHAVGAKHVCGACANEVPPTEMCCKLKKELDVFYLKITNVSIAFHYLYYTLACCFLFISLRAIFLNHLDVSALCNNLTKKSVLPLAFFRLNLHESNFTLCSLNDYSICDE